MIHQRWRIGGKRSGLQRTRWNITSLQLSISLFAVLRCGDEESFHGLQCRRFPARSLSVNAIVNAFTIRRAPGSAGPPARPTGEGVEAVEEQGEASNCGDSGGGSGAQHPTRPSDHLRRSVRMLQLMEVVPWAANL